MRENNVEQIQSASKVVISVDCIAIFMFTIIMFIHTKSWITILAYGNVSENVRNFSQRLSQSISSLFIVLILIVTFLLFYTIRKESTPFLTQVSAYIKIIGSLIMFSSVIPRWTGSIIIFFMENGAEIVILDGTDIICILIGGIFACLGMIFDYGCILQKQDDETL